MEKNVTQWLSKFARRFTTRSSVAMLQPKSAGTCQSRSATRSTRGSARPWRRKSAKLFQGPSVQRLPTGSVEASPSRNAQMCPSSSVSRFPRLTVRCLADNPAPRYHQETANRNLDVFAPLFQRFYPRRSVIVNALLIRGMSVNPFPSRFVMMSTSLVKSVMMLWSRFQGKPMRLNARPSTHRSARSLEVVDMETNQFCVENIYDLINMLSL